MRALALALVLLPGVALAQIDPVSGIDFARVGAPGNAPFTQTSPDWINSQSIGRGRVDYEYSIGRTEVTTSQWMKFINTFATRPAGSVTPFFRSLGPFYWGADLDPTYSGPGRRYRLTSSIPSANMLPVFGISWRESALFCNWLHNGKSTDAASLLTGAYDVSTWGSGPQGSFTDAPTHAPGARYWIPTFDEQLKAFHFDPNRFGPGQAGWWLDKNRRDTPGTPGLPGVGQTSAGYIGPNSFLDAFNIPLGAYADQVSPWGLLDTSGGVVEWNELLAPQTGPPRGRGLTGAAAGEGGGVGGADPIYSVSSLAPSSLGLAQGLRVASSVPSPGSVAIVIVSTLVVSFRRRRCP